MKTLIICVSVHHGSTMKIAQVISEVLDAKLIEPSEFEHENLDDHDMIGFGSGIYDYELAGSILGLIDGIDSLEGKKVFVFSTSGVIMKKQHNSSKTRLKLKNASFVGDFYCRGFNTNVFLKYIGGMNKGRPNADDLKRAKDFAASLAE